MRTASIGRSRHPSVHTTASIALLLGCALLSLSGCGDDETMEESGDKELVFVSFGGSYQDAQRKAFLEPFEEQFGVHVREMTYNGTFAEVKAKLEMEGEDWDIIDVETPVLLHGVQEDYYREVDHDLLPEDELLPEALHSNGVANCFWSTVMAYSTSMYPDESSAPKTWQDFWDLDTFPGARSLRNNPISSLEFALLADGVERGSLYPLDVERAFRSLDKIKDQVVWWSGGEEPVDLLAGGNVVMASAYNGRIFTARTEGKPLVEVWNDGLIDSDWWVIPDKNPHADLAQQFIAFASEAAQQAKLPQYIAYGPVNAVALAGLSPDVAKELPNSAEHVSNMIFIDGDWWGENLESVQAQWDAWLAKR